MPVDFLTGEQQRRYGRYAGEPAPAQLESDFHLDDKDRGLIARCRNDHTRLGFAVQLGTVRFLGTFLADPSEVPRGVVAYLARQLGIADSSGLKRYAAGVMRRDHVAEIRRSYGYRDFHEGSEAAALSRWFGETVLIVRQRLISGGWQCDKCNAPLNRGHKAWLMTAFPRSMTAGMGDYDFAHEKRYFHMKRAEVAVYGAEWPGVAGASG